VHAHANDLRVEVAHGWESLTGEPAPLDESALDAFVHAAVDDWQVLPVTPLLRRLLQWTVKLTLSPAACSEHDIAELRAAGWTDAAIHDAAQVISYFNYINRIADALGVKSEPDMPLWGKRA
jgi:alkylhydroperoxidase family enzyme